MTRTMRNPRDIIPARRAGNERGMALIIALVMLVLLTILGTWALDTSTTEIRIAGNFRTYQAAFYAAEAGIGAASIPGSSATPNSLTYVYSTYAANGYSALYKTQTSPIVSAGAGTALTTTTFLLKGPLPLGSLYESSLDDNGNPRFSGVYFGVNADGRGPNNAYVNIGAVVAQVVGN